MKPLENDLIVLPLIFIASILLGFYLSSLICNFIDSIPK